MSLVQNNQFGEIYEFGFKAADAPEFSGFVARKAELRYEPKVWAESEDGEGHVDGITTSKPDKRTINGTFTGYITSVFDPSTMAAGFTFKTRYFIIRSVSEPRNKGEYVEVSIEAVSEPNISAPSGGG
jgi:hypothetical protein